MIEYEVRLLIEIIAQSHVRQPKDDDNSQQMNDPQFLKSHSNTTDLLPLGGVSGSQQLLMHLFIGYRQRGFLIFGGRV